MSALVLGIGNILLGDEGAGVKAVEKLEGAYRFPEQVELVDGGTAGMELLSCLDNRNQLILIDALKSGQVPGTAVRVEGENVPATFASRITPHQLGISDLLATVSLTGELPEQMVLFGIEPKEMATGIGLSPEVEAGVDKVVLEVIVQLRNYGYEVQEQ